MRFLKSSELVIPLHRMFCAFLFLVVASPAWASCNGPISDRLGNEPETVAAMKRLGSSITLGDSLRAPADANDLTRHLFDRLRFELYKCNGICKDEQARYDEIAELKCRFAILGSSFEVPVVKSGWDNPHEYEGKIGSLINALCEKAAPMAPGNEREVFTPRTASETEALHACMAQYAPLDDVLHATIFSKETPLWLAHIQVWSGCIGEYKTASDLYHQTAYNRCMLARDSVTRICWNLSSIPLYDICDPQVPSDEDRRHLEDVRGKTAEQLGEGQQREESAARLRAVHAHDELVSEHARGSEHVAAKFLDSEDVAPVNDTTEAFFSAAAKGDAAGQQAALSTLRGLRSKYADRCKTRNPHACQASSSLGSELGWLTQD